jgi:hypothetical protein
MSDLDDQISGWRQRMLTAGFRAPATLEELEIHLREEIDQQRKSGLSEREAFDSAVQKLGQADTLRLEFAKSGAMNGESLMRNPRIVSLLFLAIVLTATAWLVFSAVMIGQQFLFPHDGLISMRVSNGSHVVVQNGVPTLQGTGGIISGGECHPILIPFVAAPFAVVVGFAIVGCLSLNKRRVKGSQC